MGGSPTHEELAKQARKLKRQIAKQKEEENTLRASEEKYRSMVETTSDIIWEVDSHGVFSYVNPSVNTILGYKPEELIGRSFFSQMEPA
ncbi:hypothetical protein PITCH_A840011 [uncultured Desulfobacterium sp.]|uniref:PAS domain-containing protein n=1 Tax=uncultured Desulfobacterium sp. TaxID=201089 RepID=A0A445N339_9BACT|nr:hypothetical protein PITCH_A840011 [uncultured Desulfobacterium sp.]